MIAVMGPFAVLDDAPEGRTFRLDLADRGLHVLPMTWREVDGFSSGGNGTASSGPTSVLKTTTPRSTIGAATRSWGTSDDGQ